MSNSRVDAGEVVRRSFGTVRRGFDPEEVRAYLELVARALEHADRREQELLQELRAAEERARHPVIDESVLTSSLGQRSAAVLRGAHEEAARILSQAEEAAASMVRDAQQQATDLQVNAESSAAERIAEAELEANALRQQARDEAAATLEAARVEGEAVVERAREHGRAMLDQAQEARRRVLADMAHRRRLVTEQIELFRAARDEIAGSVVGVRRSLDRIVEDLSRAEDSARAAASGAARPHAVDAGESVLVEEAERAIAELDALDVRDPSLDAPSDVDEGDRAHGPRTVLRFDDIATVVERPGHVSSAEDDASGEHRTDLAERRGDPPLAEVGAHSAAPSPAQQVPLSPEVADPATGGSDVDGLFARLRARHAGDQGAGGSEVSDQAPAEQAEQTEQTEHTEQVEQTEAAEDVDADLAEGEAEPSPDAAMFARRAELLDPVVTTLARRLKRALQDDQNRLLDRLRQGTGEWSDELLVDEASQRALYAKAATTSVRDAVTAGAAFARAIVGGRQPKSPAPDQHAIEAVSGELATNVVTLIRRRLDTGEVSDAAERIGAAYREWRGERIERLAEDSAVEAFSKGVLAGTGKRSLRWSTSDAGPGCADCEDNGLAGSVTPGEEFPTGHRNPPAHAGCRCLVLPTPS